jgi:hypothetical protein
LHTDTDVSFSARTVATHSIRTSQTPTRETGVAAHRGTDTVVSSSAQTVAAHSPQSSCDASQTTQVAGSGLETQRACASCQTQTMLAEESPKGLCSKKASFQLSHTQLESAQWMLPCVHVVLQHVPEVTRLAVAPMGNDDHQAA